MTAAAIDTLRGLAYTSKSNMPPSVTTPRISSATALTAHSAYFMTCAAILANPISLYHYDEGIHAGIISTVSFGLLLLGVRNFRRLFGSMIETPDPHADILRFERVINIRMAPVIIGAALQLAFVVGFNRSGAAAVFAIAVFVYATCLMLYDAFNEFQGVPPGDSARHSIQVLPYIFLAGGGIATGAVLLLLLGLLVRGPFVRACVPYLLNAVVFGYAVLGLPLVAFGPVSGWVYYETRDRRQVGLVHARGIIRYAPVPAIFLVILTVSILTDYFWLFGLAGVPAMAYGGYLLAKDRASARAGRPLADGI